MAITEWLSNKCHTNSSIFTGEYPVFNDGRGTIITDFERFVEYLRRSAQDVVLDGDLTNSQRNELEAFQCLLKNRLYPAQVHILQSLFDTYSL
jgi:hypothetical protein